MSNINVLTIANDNEDLLIKDPNGDLIAFIQFKNIEDVTIDIADDVKIGRAKVV